jgi:phosphoserine phosphatase RsbU/P
LISTLRESENANGESGRNSKTIFKEPLFYSANKALKSSLGHRCKLHDESTSRTIRINGNAESEEASVKEQLGRQPWSELQLARELQAEMLPAHPPSEAGWDLAARCSAAQTVGGDFYDFFRYPAKAITAQALGDASGKGASAAIYAALVAGILRSLAPLELRPAEMLWTLNRTLLKRPIRGRYVCMIYATWDERDRVFRIANAGLPYPICVQYGKLFSLKASGLPLGLFESAEYEEHTVECGTGDLVVFYTDGVTEAVDRRNEDFGPDKLEKIIATNALETADRVVNSIFLAVASHCGESHAFDDQTVIAVRT